MCKEKTTLCTRKAQCFKKDTVLLQENVADLLEETAECDVLTLSVVYDYLIMCVGASFLFSEHAQ